jgi:hypothetical protein
MKMFNSWTKTGTVFLIAFLCVLTCSAADATATGWAPAGESLAFELNGGRVIKSSDLRRTAGEAGGRRTLVSTEPAFEVEITPLDGAAFYQRTRVKVTNTGSTDLPLQRIVLLDEAAPANAVVAGEYAGSPLVVGDTVFLGVEHPYAENTVANGRIRCALPVIAPLAAKASIVASLVVGHAPSAGQLRRTFGEYVNCERPRKYAPFLLHNTWYNIGYSNPFSEKDELGIVGQLGHELIEKRGAKIDAFVLDDGWDDTRTLWRFNRGWPDGMKNLAAATARWGAKPGIWISPWGGYNQPKVERLKAAEPEGFETRNGGFSLAGPKYYARFRELCVQAMREGNVGFFKFDGIGANGTTKLDPQVAPDFDAMLRLIDELRGLKPDLYISQTVGTWPSPWWLLHVDNVWRGGEDHDFTGVGSSRQQWITYRDAQVYGNVVRKAPLFPLNSLMLHGIILAKHAEKLGTTDDADFVADVRSYFGSGAQLQELYLSPELLTAKNWDDLAAGAKWARHNADVLQDAHWIGGDPARLEPYGWAAWNARLGIVTLRNPSDHRARFALEVGSAFELPPGAPRSFTVTEGEGSASPIPSRLTAGTPVTIELKPFEVLILEARPLTP